MSNDILKTLSQSHAQFIHARGKTATNKLIELINIQPDEKVLEVGIGTASTLILNAKNVKNAHFYGVDISPDMIETAKKRIQFSNVKQNTTIHLINNTKLPFSNDFFDAIYVESVLAIQEERNLELHLLELKRVLKPEGRLIFNESIWLDSISQDEAKQLNKKAKESFGIIQSNSLFPHLSNWINLIQQVGLKIEKIIPVKNIESNLSFTDWKSDLFTLLGKLKIVFSPKINRAHKSQTLQMSKFFPEKKEYLEGIIFSIRK